MKLESIKFMVIFIKGMSIQAHITNILVVLWTCFIIHKFKKNVGYELEKTCNKKSIFVMKNRNNSSCDWQIYNNNNNFTIQLKFLISNFIIIYVKWIKTFPCQILSRCGHPEQDYYLWLMWSSYVRILSFFIDHN